MFESQKKDVQMNALRILGYGGATMEAVEKLTEEELSALFRGVCVERDR